MEFAAGGVNSQLVCTIICSFYLNNYRIAIITHVHNYDYMTLFYQALIQYYYNENICN